MVSTIAVKTAAIGALSAVAQIAKKLATMQKNDSVVQFTSALRVEPVTMIDKRLEHVDYLTDILQTLLSMFCGYYLQAVACMTNVGQINVLKMLDVLNPTRDPALAATSVVDAINGTVKPSMLSMESYAGAALPRPDAVSLESAAGKAFTAGRFMRDAEAPLRGKDLQGSVKASLDPLDKGIKAAQEATNLAVGKILEVNIESEGSKGRFPVAVRLATSIVDTDVLIHILGSSGHDNSFSERRHRWKAGDLQFWRDLVFCQDMIDEQRKLLRKDKSGVMAELNRRRSMNAAAALSSGTPSIGSASALVVIDRETALELERANLGQFSDIKFRNKIFNDSLTMLMVVVDRDREVVTIYTRDIQLPSRHSVRELKGSNKGGGVDVGEILKAYRLGQSPVF